MANRLITGGDIATVEGELRGEPALEGLLGHHACPRELSTLFAGGCLCGGGGDSGLKGYLKFFITIVQ